MFTYLFMFLAAVLLLVAASLVFKRMLAAGQLAEAEKRLDLGEAATAEDDAAPDNEARGRKPSTARMPPVSLVLLQRQAMELSREKLAGVIARVCGLAITDAEGSEAFWAMPPMPSLFPMVIRHNLYAVTLVHEPYPGDRDWYVDDDTAPETLSAWQKHRAWVSIDLVAAKGNDDPLEFIGRLAADLAQDDSLAVVHPAERHAVAFDPEVRTRLRKQPVKQVVTGPLRAFALLRKTPRPLTQSLLTITAQRAWGVKLTENPRDPSCAVVAANGLAFLQHEGMRFGVAAAPGRYVPEMKQAAASIDDVRLRAAFEAHTNWWGVDFVEAAVNISKARMYQLLGRLAAELLDENVTMLFATEYRRAAVADETLRQRLRGQDPLEAVFFSRQPPLLQVKGDEPAMRQAIAEARRRWPEFVGAFVGRKSGHHFAIKRGFASDQGEDHQEFMWVQVIDIHEDQIVGVLDNDPVHVKGLKAGDRVVSQANEVIDWLYQGDEDLVGNFTGPVILAAQRRQE